jgi:hypothetical protein
MAGGMRKLNLPAMRLFIAFRAETAFPVEIVSSARSLTLPRADLSVAHNMQSKRQSARSRGERSCRNSSLQNA